MRDIYLYDDIDVMNNKLNIKNKEELEKAEADITYIKLLDIDRATANGVFNLKHLKAIHKYMFEDIYEWAGEIRTVNIEKSEKLLNGMSVEYCDYSLIERECKNTLHSLKTIEWGKLSYDDKIEYFAKYTGRLWQIHPFREGNTRAIITFMTQFAASVGIDFDRELLRNKAQYVRDALVMTSIGEYSEYIYLINILKEVIVA